MKKIYIGTSGFNYKSWKGKLYPEGLAQKNWLSYYSQNFKTLEVNATFYRHFPKTVFEKWYAQTEKDFLFTIKGPRLITHIKRLSEVDESLDMFFESIAGLGKKLAVVLWQFPASFKNKTENFQKLETFLRKLPKKIHYVVELRDQSWFDPQVFKLLDTCGTGWVINETQAFATFETVCGNVAYIRFHGPTFLYASSYSDKQLAEWAEKIENYAQKKEVFCYFNNDVSGYAVGNAKTLMDLLNR